MKDNTVKSTIQSSNLFSLMTDILESSPEGVSGFLEIALQKILVDTGSDHVFLSALDINIYESRNVFIPLDASVISKAIQSSNTPFILSFENHLQDTVHETLYQLMKVRFIETWIIIPLGFESYLSIEYTSSPQQIEAIIQSLSWFIKTFTFKLKYIKLSEELDQTILAKSEFLSNMSHEIRTPLSGIYNAFYLLNTTGLSQEQHEYVNNGMTSVDQLSSIIDDVLDYATIESGHMSIHETKFDLEVEMIRLYQQYKPMADEKKLSLQYHFDQQLERDYLGDIAKIRQIMGHILDNAIKYTDQGFIHFSTILKSYDNTTSSIEISVKDSGIGIPTESLSTIKDAFVQMETNESKRYPGAGLGLSIASELVSLLQGQLDVESVLIEGSLFKVTLPLKPIAHINHTHLNGIKALIITQNTKPSRLKSILESIGIECYALKDIGNNRVHLIVIEDDALELSDVMKLRVSYGQPNVFTMSPMIHDEFQLKDIDIILEWPISRQSIEQKISNRLNQRRKDAVDIEFEKELKGHALVVDDNRLNRVALQSILLKQGIRSTTVESGQKAIEQVKKESFDIIFMDIQMPNMDGLETTRRIRNLGASYEHVPIIAITANQYFKDYDLMKSTQINDVLFKPIRMEHLGQVLRKYIPQERGIVIPEELIVFDAFEFNERFDGSDDIAIEVMHTFLEEYQRDLYNISQAVAHKDPKQIHETTHYFKGSCAYLSGKRAVWLLSQMTQLAKQGRLESMSMLQNLLEKEVLLLVKSVQTKLK